jgi:membrane protein DedA with SNARE-associated domain
MLDFIENVINTVGYAGIVVMMFLENIFPPIPSEIIMPAAGFSTRNGAVFLLRILIKAKAGWINMDCWRSLLVA